MVVFLPISCCFCDPEPLANYLEGTMSARQSSLSYYLTRLAMVVLGVLIIYFLVGIGMRLADNQKQAQRLEAAEEELQVLEVRNAELLRQLEFVQSEAAVVLWARELGLARVHEVPVILVEPSGGAAPEAGAATGAPAPEADGEPVEEEPGSWWELLFGH
jgi:cell division protein FtsB